MLHTAAEGETATESNKDLLFGKMQFIHSCLCAAIRSVEAVIERDIKPYAPACAGHVRTRGDPRSVTR